MTLRVWWILGLLASCSAGGSARDPGEVAKAFLGTDAIELFRDAERIESYRVKRELEALPPDAPAMSGVRVLARGRDLDAGQREMLRRWLFGEAAYAQRAPKGCEPMPGVLLRTWKGDRYADLALCYECKMWGIAVQSAPSEFPGRWENFDPVAKDLAGLAKQLFPDDPVIRGL